MRRITKPVVFGLLLVCALAMSANASPVLTFQGTGSDSDISFQFTSSVPLDTPGLLTTFSFDYCNAPPGESCDQVNYSAPSGVIRFVAVGDTLDVRTFEFDSFVDNGVYSTLASGSPNSGTVTVTGSINGVPEPSSAMAGLGVVALLVVYRSRCRDRRRGAAEIVRGAGS